MPFMECEYVHAMGNGPGGLAEYERAFAAGERNLGGFVWEWLEHGIRQRTADGREFYAYGGDFGEPVHDGNFVADGLVDADRRPRPGLADVKVAFAPVGFELDGLDVTVTNRYDVLDLSALAVEWERVEPDGAVRQGVVDLPVVAPRGTGRFRLPDQAAGAGVLTVRATLRADTAWAEAGHEIAWAQSGAVAVPAAPLASAAPVSDGRWVEIGPARIDVVTGNLVLGGSELHGPELVLWRAPTDNDLGIASSASTGEPLPTRSEAEDWEAAELPRLTTRVVGVRISGDAVEVETQVAPRVYDFGARVVLRYTSDGETLGLSVRVEPTGDWPCTWARVGLRFRLPEVTAAQWTGRGPGPAYPDTGLGQRMGRGRPEPTSCVRSTSARRRAGPAATSWTSGSTARVCG